MMLSEISFDGLVFGQEYRIEDKRYPSTGEGPAHAGTFVSIDQATDDSLAVFNTREGQVQCYLSNLRVFVESSAIQGALTATK